MEAADHPKQVPCVIGRLCFLVFLVYLATASGTIFGSDGTNRFLVTQSLIDQGRLDIKSPIRTPVGRDGKQYSQYAIGHTLLMAPLYITGKQLARFDPSRREEITEFCVSMTNLLITVLSVWLLASFARELGFRSKTCLVLGLLYAFGTTAWQQSKDSFEHPQIALYLLALFYCLNRFSSNKRLGTLAAASVAMNFALLTRYTSSLACPAIFLFLVYTARHSNFTDWPRKAAVWVFIFGALLLPSVAFAFWFNHVRFGSLWETGQQQLFGHLFSSQGFFKGLWGLTLDPEQGFLVFNPLLLLLPIGALRFYRRFPGLTLPFLFLLGLYLVFYSSVLEILWRGGWCWGGRFFVDILPLLVLMCGPVFENGVGHTPGSRLLRYGAPILIALSVAVQAGSVLVNYNRGFAKRALGIGHHSFARHDFRESPLYLQGEGIVEIGSRLWRGDYPSRRTVPAPADLDSLDDSFTFGTFQLWWVYALHLGLPLVWVLLYLAGTLLSVAWTGRILWANP